MRLIDADALIARTDLHIIIGAGDNICIDIADIAKAPTIDPEALRPKGRWVMDKLEIGNPYDVNSTMVVDIGNCSCCDYRCEMLPIMNYCPNCGADMRGESDARD